ncbi:lysostaphin resistance A-like protein [Lacticaseibacillus chiayiensis]|uniref:CPBP family intramembrane glutamic endopeptidase n=1 Tax=Lacticaseibacillus chiayiensis TaxID=2100821 RepID=UPI003C7326EB
MLSAFILFNLEFLEKLFLCPLRDLLIGILLGLFLLGIEWLLSSHLPGSNVATGPRLKLSLFSICVSGPLWEEFIFRYYLNLKTFKGSFSGMIISSLIFSVIHGYVGLLLLALFFLFGIIFSVVDFYRKNVFVSSIAHIVLNTIILLLNFSG